MAIFRQPPHGLRGADNLGIERSVATSLSIRHLMRNERNEQSPKRFGCIFEPGQGAKTRFWLKGDLRMNLRLVSAAIALVVSAMLLGAGVYESVVVAPNFQ